MGLIPRSGNREAVAEYFTSLGFDVRVTGIELVSDGTIERLLVVLLDTTPTRLWDAAEQLDRVYMVEPWGEICQPRFHILVWPVPEGDAS